MFRVKAVAIIVILIIPLLIGGFFAQKSYSLSQFLKQADAAFESGNYMAALANYFSLQESDPGNNEIAEKIENTKELLVAKENFKKAKEAAERGDWLSVKPLLLDIPDSSNSLYEEMLSLYQEAAEKVKVLEDKIAFEIAALKNEATRTKREREKALAEALAIEVQLKNVQAQKEEIERQAQIAQQETEDALKLIEEERVAKFFNELSLLIDLLKNGENLLSQAISHIESGNNITALSFLNQARSLFDNVKEHGQDLKENRTPEQYMSTTEKLLESSSLFASSVLNLASATIFFPEDLTYFNSGRELFLSGVNLLNELQAFSI